MLFIKSMFKGLYNQSLTSYFVVLQNTTAKCLSVQKIAVLLHQILII